MGPANGDADREEAEIARISFGRRIRVPALFAAGLASSLLPGLLGPGPQEAAAGPGAIACGTTVTTSITLTADLLDCPDNGLVVGADGITIDLNGHTIDGDEALDETCGKKEICDVGIVNEGFDDVTIAGGGGAVREFGLGLLSFEMEGMRLRDAVMRRNVFSAIVVAAARQTKLRKLTVQANGVDTDQAGIDVFDSRKTLIAGSTISANGDIGIFTEGSARSRIVRNRFAANPEGGIIGDGRRTLIADNRFARNGDGIGWGGDHNLIRGNGVTGSSTRGQGGGQGIEFGGGRHNRIVGNTIRRVDRYGVVIEAYGPIRGVVAAGNSVRNAGKDGLFVRDVLKSAKRVRLRNNRAIGAEDDGIDVAIRSASLQGNVARRNGDHGIEAHDGVRDGGGNRASGNGNPDQCKNVVCA